MSRSIGRSLAFHIRYAQDIVALQGEKGCPEGVQPDDWKKYEEVLGWASQQAAELAIECRDKSMAALKDWIEPTSGNSKSRRPTVEWEWRAWTDFKLRGAKSATSAGWLQVLIDFIAPVGEAEPGETCLVAYVRARAGEQKASELAEAISKVGLGIPDKQRPKQLDGSDVAILSLVLKPDSDADAIVATVVEAFKKAAPCFAALG
jgi:hypothetical protein